MVVSRCCCYCYCIDRAFLFERDFGDNFDSNKACDNETPWELTCKLCGLEDFENRFVRYCDCGVPFHTRCHKTPNLFVPPFCKEEDFGEEEKCYKNNWFCLYCVNYATSTSIENGNGDGNDGDGRQMLISRRKQEMGPLDEYEVDFVLSHEPDCENYCVRWKNYPREAACVSAFGNSYAQKVDMYWTQCEVCTVFIYLARV